MLDCFFEFFLVVISAVMSCINSRRFRFSEVVALALESKKQGSTVVVCQFLSNATIMQRYNFLFADGIAVLRRVKDLTENERESLFRHWTAVTRFRQLVHRVMERNKKQPFVMRTCWHAWRALRGYRQCCYCGVRML